MAEENTNNQQTEETNETDYIEIVKNLKENSVEKREYERIKAENLKLMKTLAEGGQLTNEDKAEQVNVAALRKELYNSDNDFTNLEYVKKSLDLRNAIIEQGGADPFLPIGHQITANADDIAAANRVAEVFQHCVDYAAGDSAAFTAELQRLTKDVAVPISTRRR